MRIKGFIFDIDGTLLDSNDAHAESLQYGLRQMGYDIEYVAIRRTIGMGFDRVVPSLIGYAADSEVGKKIGKYKDLYFYQKFSNLKPFPEAKELIATLCGDGLKVTVASSASKKDLKILLEQIGIEEYVIAPISADDIPHSKPAPDAILAALKTLKLKPEEVYMVGDAPYDVEAALRAGVKTIAFRTGGWTDSDLRSAAMIVDGPSELLSLIQQKAPAEFQQGPWAFS